MTFIFGHGPLVWVILAVVGLIAWGALGSAGVYAVVRIHQRGAHGSAIFAGIGLAISAVVLFIVYLVVIGGLSIALFPN